MCSNGKVKLFLIHAIIKHNFQCSHFVYHILHFAPELQRSWVYVALIKQLLDSVFVISRPIKVEVRVISRSQRLRLITLTETLIILDITKTESSNCFIIH